ncbi:MAG: efflux RND transporter periplasmic adaptor subunit [Novosphingobium sp.]
MNYETRIDPSHGPSEAAMSGSDSAMGDLDANPLETLDDEERRSRRSTWLVIAIAAAILIGLWFVLHPKEDATAAADLASQGPTVTVISPGRTTIQGSVSASGTLGARREMPVGSVGEGGQVAQVMVEAGAWVRQGQVLAVIDRSVQVQQQVGQSAQINVAQANARLAQANLDRALKLVARGFISKADVDRLTATRDAAAAQVGVASAQLGQLRAQAARLNIVAPADGLLLERKIEPGQTVGPSSGVLFRIAKGGEMELLARLSETDLAAMTVGASAAVTPVGTARAFTGQIWQLSPVIDPQTRQGTARIALAYAPELRPGGFASVTINSGTMVAPQLPESAILSDNKGAYVFVVGNDKKARRRDVKTGPVNESGIAIVSGLSGSERVVLRAGGFLSPGDAVNPVTARP